MKSFPPSRAYNPLPRRPDNGGPLVGLNSDPSESCTPEGVTTLLYDSVVGILVRFLANLHLDVSDH